MPYETLVVEKRDRIAIITLNRPEKFNALNFKVLEELPKALQEVKNDKDVWVVIITGSGKAFCAGGDVLELLPKLAEMGVEEVRRIIDEAHRAVIEMRYMPKPIIAAVNGVAAGAGFSLVMACDVVIAAENAQFVTAYGRIGACGDFGMSYLLPRTIGYHRACELFFTNRRLSAKEAEELGIVNKVVPADKVMEEAEAFAKKIIEECAPLALGIFKQNMARGIDMCLEDELRDESVGMAVCSRTKDWAEGLLAFKEKRAPVWKGE